MDFDKKLLQEISNIGQPMLHFYDWEGPSATHGYFINPFQYLDAKGIESVGLKLGRRPTGGGIVFHLTDLTFSVLVPAAHPAYSMNTLENYAFVNRHVAQAILHLKKEVSPTLLQTEARSLDSITKNFCMAKPTVFDVMVGGKKVGGAAQRRTRDGFLHQGTISIAPPPEKILQAVLKPGTSVLEAMKCHSYMLMETTSHEHDLKRVCEELRRLLILEFEKNT